MTDKKIFGEILDFLNHKIHWKNILKFEVQITEPYGYELTLKVKDDLKGTGNEIKAIPSELNSLNPTSVKFDGSNIILWWANEE